MRTAAAAGAGWLSTLGAELHADPLGMPIGCQIKNYFVEMNLDSMKASVPYLRQLNV
jgi:hypothetical protein